MIDCKVCCKICEQTFCRYAGTKRGLEVDCRYYTPKQKPQTNADRIRAMIDEDMAAKMYCPYMKDIYDECKFGWHTPTQSCFECKLEWLRQPAKDGEERCLF